MADSFNPYQHWFGIPSKAQPPNYYRLLGLELFEDSKSKIEDAVAARVEYLQALSMGEHVEDAQRILCEVALARLCLVNAEKKREYDDQLRLSHGSNQPIPFAKTVDSESLLNDAIRDLNVATARRTAGEKKNRSRVANSSHPPSLPGGVPTSPRLTTDAPPKLTVDSESKPLSRHWPLMATIGILFGVAVGIAVYLFPSSSEERVANQDQPTAPEFEKPEQTPVVTASTNPQPPSRPGSPPANTKTARTETPSGAGTTKGSSGSPAPENDSANKGTPRKSTPGEAVRESTKATPSSDPSGKSDSANPTSLNVPLALADHAFNAQLVAYWPLNDGRPNRTVLGADDIIDDPNHGATDAVASGRGDTWVFDEIRNRVVLNTTEGNRLVAGNQDIDLNRGFTWSLWAKIASTNKIDDGADVLIGTRRGNWHKMGTGSVAGWATLTGFDLADDQWHHIAYTGDAANGVSLYIDGQLAATGKAPQPLTYNGVLEIGGSSQFTEDLTGRISDVAIWNARLSESRIQDLASGGNVLATSSKESIVVDDFVTLPLSGQGGVYQVDLGKVAPKFDASGSDKLVVMTGSRGSGGQDWGKDLSGIRYGDQEMIEAVKLKSGDQDIPEEVAGIYYLDKPGAAKSLTISYSAQMSPLGGITLLALSGTANGVSSTSANVTTGSVTTASTKLATKVDGSIVVAVAAADGTNPRPAKPLNCSTLGTFENFGASGQVVSSAGPVTTDFAMSSGTTPVTIAAAFAPATVPNYLTARPNFAKLNFATPHFVSLSPARPPAATNNVASKEKTATGQPAGNAKVGAAETSFKDFAAAFDLPPISDQAPTLVDQLAIGQAADLNLKLVVADGAVRNKIEFRMDPDSEDPEKWIVHSVEQQSSSQVAQFWSTGKEFFFQWLPASADDENVNYLRNAALKLNTSDGQTTWLSLRKPVAIEGFQLKRDKSSVSTKTDVEWLPNPNAMVVEISPYPVKEISSYCVSPLVTKRPALMYFTEDRKKAFVWLEVDASHRSDHHRLEAELKANIQGVIQPLKPVELKEFQQFFMKLGSETEKQLGSIKDAKEKTRAKEFATAAKTTANIFGEYTKLLPKIHQTAIPISIYMNVEDHKILIAETGSVRQPEAQRP